MEPLLSTLVLILLALLGANLSFSTEHVPSGPRLLFKTGTHFVLVGFILGPAGLELFSAEALEQLSPLLVLGLGWVGLLFGMQLDRDTLGQFPRSFHTLALVQAVLAFLFFAGVGLLGLEMIGRSTEVTRLMVWGAAATACLSTPAGIAIVSSNFLVRGNMRRLLFFVASLDAVVGIIALQVIYSLLHPTPLGQAFGAVPALGWMVVSLGLGTVCGIVFLWLTRKRPDSDELVLFLMGGAAFAAGAAMQLQLSPLFVSVVMGAVVANLSPGHRRVFRNLQRWEKPVYVVLLIMAGAFLRFPTLWIIPLAAAYVILRVGAKVAGGAIAVRMIPLPFTPPKRLGLGLMPQGGISLALAISLMLTFRGLDPDGLDAIDTLFSIVLIGVVVSELAGPVFTTAALRQAGEISPEVEQALAVGDAEEAQAQALRHVPTSDEEDA
jgi:Sodium/hydrogen exchanger family